MFHVKHSGQGEIALLAGAGALPGLLRAAHPKLLAIGFEGTAPELPRDSLRWHRFERLGALFYDLRACRITGVVMAGAITRPRLDPACLDATTAALLPGLSAAMAVGDDAALRFVIAAFEAEGFAVIGAHELLPDLVSAPGLLAGPPPSEQMLSDGARGFEILDHMSALDIGQAVAVGQGLCLGLETLAGTDALLADIACHRARFPKGGVLVKAPKRGQDLRADMPALGVRTVEDAQKAGLCAIAFAAGEVMLLDRANLLARADALGITLWAEARA